MKTVMVDGKPASIPSSLNDFQQEMYQHLIAWKWKNIPEEADRTDAKLSEECQRTETWPHLYPDAVEELKRHRVKNPFRIHRHFYHMASSQAANANLFLPLLLHPSASVILGSETIKPDLKTIATEYMDNGYCLEYWGGNFPGSGINVGETGLLNDKSKMAGTDSDIAIAYRNHNDELCLWLIEHKLTEVEFTECGGYKAWMRQKKRPAGMRYKGSARRHLHNCNKSFADILKDKRLCYYHDICHYKYWEITQDHLDFFANHAAYATCPFRGGMNQLWRNQLLAFALEQPKQPFKHVYFSVVKHSGNKALDATLGDYKELIANDTRFSVFTSADIMNAASECADAKLRKWIDWYKNLYKL